ncbi:diphthamide biosynthesis enzyme Dph2 [archaeon]
MIPERVVRELKQNKNTRVLVQLPEGLKTKATEICGELRQAGFEPIVSGDPCFGACDLKTLKNATTLHVAHSEFVKQENIVYWEYEYGQSLIPAVEKALPLLDNSVGLFTTVQHLQQIPAAKEALEKAGKQVFTAPGKTTKEYQILGCDAAGAVSIKDKVDSFLYIGGGRFHPIAIAYYTKKPVVAIDPFSLEAQEIDSAAWEKERALRQTKAMNADSYGIVVSSKPGQKNWNIAETIKKKLESADKKTLVIYLENITPDTLLPFNVDAFVITACPRIVVDDWKNYTKAVLLPEEA